MVLLLLLAACWRPSPYTPPDAPTAGGPVEQENAPVEEPGEVEGLPADEAPDAETDAAEAPPGDGEAEDGEAGDDAAVEDAPDTPPFQSYKARTVQAPASIVDDYGKPIAVIGVVGWELEVRGEEEIRVRVWCEKCDPAVEGWLQPQLVARAD